MRDPARVDRMIEKLRLLWKGAPDLRLGQLVDTVACDQDPNLYYIEDDEMEAALDKILSKGWKP